MADSYDLVEVVGNQQINSGESIVPFTVYLSENFAVYKLNSNIDREIVTVTPDSNGDWAVDLIENTNMAGSVGYIFDFGDRTSIKVVPSTPATHDYYDLETL